jgi:hypothetical protein
VGVAADMYTRFREAVGHVAGILMRSLRVPLMHIDNTAIYVFWSARIR